MEKDSGICETSEKMTANSLISVSFYVTCMLSNRSIKIVNMQYSLALLTTSDNNSLNN